MRPLARIDALCPNCDEVVPGGALSCPSCGSDSETGWSDGADVWAGDVPSGYDDDEDDDFDYEAALEAEGLLPSGASARGRAEARRRLLIWIALVLLVVVLVFGGF